MKKIQHKKYKNTGILFELLSKQVTWDVLSGKNNAAMNIIKRHFSKGSTLHEELRLYKSVLDTPVLKEYKATKLLDLITEKHKSIDTMKRNKELYNLIGEIKRNYEFGNFFNSRIKNYKVYASVYKLFEGTSILSESNTKYDVSDEYDSLVEFLTTDRDADKTKIERQLSLIERQDPDIKQATFKALITRFNEKYGSLNKKQKRVVNKYITENIELSDFRNFVLKEVTYIEKVLIELAKRVHDKNLKVKLTGTIPLLSEIKTSRLINENHISSLIKYHELIDVVKELIHDGK